MKMNELWAGIAQTFFIVNTVILAIGIVISAGLFIHAAWEHFQMPHQTIKNEYPIILPGDMFKHSGTLEISGSGVNLSVKFAEAKKSEEKEK